MAVAGGWWWGWKSETCSSFTQLLLINVSRSRSMIAICSPTSYLAIYGTNCAHAAWTIQKLRIRTAGSCCKLHLTVQQYIHRPYMGKRERIQEKSVGATMTENLNKPKLAAGKSNYYYYNYYYCMCVHLSMCVRCVWLLVTSDVKRMKYERFLLHISNRGCNMRHVCMRQSINFVCAGYRNKNNNWSSSCTISHICTYIVAQSGAWVSGSVCICRHRQIYSLSWRPVGQNSCSFSPRSRAILQFSFIKSIGHPSSRVPTTTPFMYAPQHTALTALAGRSPHYIIYVKKE